MQPGKSIRRCIPNDSGKIAEQMKPVMITGANRGLGLGLTRYYLEAGCQVIAAARSAGHSVEFRSLKEQYGGHMVPIELDLNNEAVVTNLQAQLQGTDPGIVINNAGVSTEEPLGQWSAAVFEDSLKINTIGPALVAQALLPLMKPGSKLVNISSGMGSIEMNINPDNGLDAYAMSKAALNMLSRRLAEKQRARDVIVASVSPGWVRTDMGGEEAPTSVPQAVKKMASVIDGLTMEQAGQFFDCDGEKLPW